MARWRCLTLVVALVCVGSLSWAGDYLFLNPPYLAATRDVVAEARERAADVFKGDDELIKNFNEFCQSLDGIVIENQREQIFKKVKANKVEQLEDAAFAKALNDFKDGLNAMGDTAGKPLQELLPSYDRWNRLETAVVKQGLDQRLAAYHTRFGPESEPINVLEFLVSQKFLPGDESGPAPWEPIMRVAAVQATSRGSGLTSTAQVGLNYYFVRSGPPFPLKWLGVSNHVGVAAMVQYLDNPGILEFKGRPSFGVMLHLDRKEIGVSWDNAEDRLNLTVGYAFQFIPMMM